MKEVDPNTLPIGDTNLYYPEAAEQAHTGFIKDIVSEMLVHITLGANLTDVANIVRLPPERVRDWYNKNYCNFKYEVDYCRSDHKRRWLKNMMDGKNTKASQFMLERKYRDEYGKEIKIEVTSVMIDNISKIVFDSAVRFITDPDMLRLFIEQVSQQIEQLKGSEGMPEHQKLIA